METKQDASSSNTTEVESATTIYHIYHAGHGDSPVPYSFHSIRDSDTTILSDPNPKFLAPPLASEAKTPNIPPKPPKKPKRACALDNPLYDPRTETAPYYLTQPILLGHSPPYTLRTGGHKHAPVTCLLHASWRWKGWRLEFGNILSQPGVIDGRGVVSAKYGTSDGRDGTLKGYKVRRKRYWGESGKKWWVGEKERGFPEGMDFEEVAEEGKARSDEVVQLWWPAPFSARTRNHRFRWRGYEFMWKGTRKVETKKGWRPFLFCNHLKLVVTVPEDASSISKDVGRKEVCLAKYTCVIGIRKAGRLEVYQDIVNKFLANHILPPAGGDDKGGEEESSPLEETKSEIEEAAKTQERIRDVIIGTSICMIMTEREKRRFLLEILLLIADILGD